MKTIKFIPIIFILLFCGFAKAQSWEEFYQKAAQYHQKALQTNNAKDFQSAYDNIIYSKKIKEKEKDSIDYNYIKIYKKITEILKDERGDKDSKYLQSLDIFLNLCYEYAMILNNQAEICRNKKKFDLALPLYYESMEMLNLCDSNDVIIGRVKVLYNTGLLFQNKCDFDSAFKYFRSSFEICNVHLSLFIQDSLKIYVKTIIGLADVLELMGNLDEADSLCQHGIQTLESNKITNSSGYADLLNFLAKISIEKDNSVRADSLLFQSMQVRKNRCGEICLEFAQSMDNIGGLYYRLGLIDKAEPYILKALEIRENLFLTNKDDKTSADYAVSLNSSAVLSFTKYHEKAVFDDKLVKKLFKALEIREKIDNKSFVYIESLNNLGGLFTEIRNYKTADSLFRIAKNISYEIRGKNSLQYAKSLGNLAINYFEMGQLDSCEACLKEELEIRKTIQDNNHPDVAIVLGDLSLIYELKGRNKEADSLYKETIGIYLNNLNKYFQILNESEKLVLLDGVNVYINHYESFFLKNYYNNNSAVSAIFDLRLATKGMVLNSSTHLKNIIFKSGDTSLISLFKDKESLSNKLSKSYTLTKDELSRQGINLKQLEDSLNKIEKQLSLDANKNNIEYDITKSVKCVDLQNVLRPDEAAIEFVDIPVINNNKWTDTVWYCAIILTKENPPDFVKLCTEAELKEVLKYKTSEPKVDTLSYVNNPETSNKLYNLTIHPLEKYLEGKTKIIISPSGILNRVSFEALKINEGDYLIDKYNIFYVTNLKNILLRNKTLENPDKKINEAVLYGGINYTAKDTLKLITSAKQNKENSVKKTDKQVLMGSNDYFKPQTGTFYELGGIEVLNEIDSILSQNELFKVRKYSGDTATEESFKTLSGKRSPSVIFVYTHGFYFPDSSGRIKEQAFSSFKPFQIMQVIQNPMLRSGIVFSGADRFASGKEPYKGIDNGLLTADEASNLYLYNTDLLILSACETGLGDIKGSEGVFGLQRAFKSTGVKTIIMSLWQVSKVETAELFKLFFKKWIQNGLTDKKKAFREAQLELKETLEKSGKHYSPFYWASFILLE